MNEESKKIQEYLEYAYSGAKMMGDFETMCRIARALIAFQLDIEENCTIKSSIKMDIDYDFFMV